MRSRGTPSSPSIESNDPIHALLKAKELRAEAALPHAIAAEAFDRRGDIAGRNSAVRRIVEEGVKARDALEYSQRKAIYDETGDIDDLLGLEKHSPNDENF